MILCGDSDLTFGTLRRYVLHLLCFQEVVDNIEQNRVTARPDFAYMHNLSRHAIHVSEVLSVIIETIESIQKEQKEMYESLETDLGKTYCRKAREYTRFQLQMVKSLKMRSDSNYQRLKNEITLVIKFFTLRS